MVDINVVELENEDIVIELDGNVTSWSEIYGDPSACKALIDLIEKKFCQKVDKNPRIEGDTKCKITYDEKGLVIKGEDLTADDLPELLLECIKDVIATADEVNTLHGLTASTDELNILDGAEITTEELNLLKGLKISASSLNTLDDTSAGKLDKNADITAGTHTKITYDKKGLVTKGENLSISDIPTLPLTKIGDVKATAQELNLLKGLQVTADTLNKTQERLDKIASVISEDATTDNVLVDEQWVKNYVYDNTGYFLTKTARGDLFETYEDLMNTFVFYHNRDVKIVGDNDYVIIKKDETHNDAVTRYYWCQNDVHSGFEWRFQYKVSNNYDDLIFSWGNIEGDITDQTDLSNALNAKQNNVTGGATTVLTDNLTPDVALISNSEGKIATSNVSTTELAYLKGVTSNIQTQINTKANTDDLAKVAISGSYTDLSNKPTIPTITNTYSATSNNGMSGVAVASAISDKANTADLAVVATSGSYTDLTDKPTIPTVDTALSSTSLNPVQNKVINTALSGKANKSHTHTASDVTDLAAVATSGSYADLVDTPTLADVATSGSYADLTDKPTIPTVTSTYSATSTNAMNGVAVASAISGKANTSSLAKVATSGSYDDLTDTPAIPAAVTETTVSGWGFTKNTGTVTSVNNVAPVKGNVTLSIPTVPTKVSAFTNDADYITTTQEFSDLKTTSKTLVGAINELYASITALQTTVSDLQTSVNTLLQT